MKKLNKLVGALIVYIKKGLAYPFESFAGMLLGLIDLLVFYFIWKAIYNGQNMFEGISYENIVTYIVLARTLYQLLSWGMNKEISNLVQNGDIAIELVRPVNFIFSRYASRLGKFIIEIFISAIPMLLLGVFLGLAAPISIVNFLIFLFSIFFAITIAFLVEFIVGVIGFYTVSVWGIQCLKQALIAFFSGSLVPIEMMPIWLQNVTKLLPFKSMIYFPISVYIGTSNSEQIVSGLIGQALWILGLGILAQVFYKMAIKKVVVAGG